MRLQQRYLAIMSRLVPMGAVGASIVLGPAAAGAAERPAPIQPPAVSERLAAIREAVFVVVGPPGASRQADPDFHLVWGNRWNNWGWGRRPSWGWGRPGWNNWRNLAPRWNNWPNAWRNW